MRGRKHTILSAATGVVASTFTISAFAALQGLPGLNEVQTSLATAVQSAICPGLAATPSRTDPQQNLFIACNRMIHSSNAILGSGDTTNSLDLTQGQLIQALSELDHQEVITHETTVTETAQSQFDNIASRMSALRGATSSRGVGGLSFNLGDKILNADDALASLYNGVGGGAGSEGGNASWFINGAFNFGDKTASSREEGFKYDTYGITGGMDWRLSDIAFAGFALGYYSLDADLRDSTDSAESNGVNVSIFGTIYRTNDWYIDGIASYGQNSYDTTRDLSVSTAALNAQEGSSGSGNLASNLNSNISGSTDGEQTALSLGLGKNHAINGLSWSPYARVEYIKADVDGYSEAGSSGLELQIEGYKAESLQGVVGVDLNTTASLNNSVVSQLLRFEYHHEFENKSQSIKARYVNDPTATAWGAPTDRADSNFFIIGAGLSAVYQNGLQAFVYYETTVGLADMTNHAVVFGLRSEI